MFFRKEEKAASAKLIIDAAAASEMETLRDKYTAAIEENNSLSVSNSVIDHFVVVTYLILILINFCVKVRVQTLERERLEGDEQVSKLKETVASQNREVSDLLAQVTPLCQHRRSSLTVWLSIFLGGRVSHL